MRVFIGIDVSEKRGCAIAAIDESGRSQGVRWSRSEVADVVKNVRDLTTNHEAFIGIDSPRMPVNTSRQWYWCGKNDRWRRRRTNEAGWGRHCEIIVSSLNLANPQWTPPKSKAPKWMQIGFELFVALQSAGNVFEVFPTASYRQWNQAGANTLRLELLTSEFGDSPEDILDAYASAMTVREYVTGNGSSVGGGDGLGQIILPAKLPEDLPPKLFEWPSSG